MLKNNNHESSSSSSQATEITLSNKEQKLYHNWIVEIYQNLKTPGSKPLEQLLKSYASKNEGRGTHILALALSRAEVFRDESKTDKMSLMTFAVLRAMTCLTADERERMRDALKLMLPFCSKLLPRERHPLMLVFDNADELKPIRKRHQFVEIVKVFLDDPEIFNIKGKQFGSNIIHSAAMFDCGSLFLLLDKRPDMINSLTSTGGTPLMSAIQYKQTNNAIEMINKRNADLNQRNNQGASPLALAIALGNIEVAACLLEKGCGVDADTNFSSGFNEAMINVLSNAGYFLVKNHIDGAKEVADFLCRHNTMISGKLGFFSLISQDKQSMEVISTPDQILNTKIIPSDSQIIRLHRSFLEVKNQHENTDKESIKTWYISTLYAAFNERFPNPSQHNIEIQKPRTPQSESLDLDLLPTLLTTVASSESMISELESYQSRANRIFDHENRSPSSIERLKKHLASMERSSRITLMKINLDDPDQETELLEFVEKIIYQYLQKILLPLILRATKSDIEEMMNNINYFIAAATEHVFNSQAKSFLPLIETIDTIVKRYKEVDILYGQICELNLLGSTQKIIFYAECGFYGELVEILEQIKGFGLMFTKNEYNDSCIYALIAVMKHALDHLPETPSDIELKLKVLEGMDSLLVTITEKRHDLREGLNQVRAKFKTKHDTLGPIRLNLITAAMQKNQEIYRLEEASESKIKISFEKKFLSLVDPTLLRKHLKTLEIRETTSQFYSLTINNASLTELYGVIDKLNNLDVDALKPKVTNTLTTATEAIENQSSSSSSFYVETNPQADVIRQPIKKEKAKVKTAPVEPLPEPVIDLAVIIAQIRVTLGLPNSAEVFHIDHRGFPESRRHLCFGLWGEISGKNITTIPEQVLKSHHDLAVTGKVVTQAHGANGLKASKVMNESGDLVNGLKTKYCKSNHRIYSAPVNVDTNTGEQAVVYVFGVAAGHKEEAPKINTTAIINKLKVKV